MKTEEQIKVLIGRLHAMMTVASMQGDDDTFKHLGLVMSPLYWVINHVGGFALEGLDRQSPIPVDKAIEIADRLLSNLNEVAIREAIE